MAGENLVSWQGHRFHVLTMGAKWSAHSGIYIFAGFNSENLWVPLYIGQASQFCERLASHERWEEAVQLGATHVHAMVAPLQENRDLIESQLIQCYQPPLNVQLKAAIERLVRRRP